MMHGTIVFDDSLLHIRDETWLSHRHGDEEIAIGNADDKFRAQNLSQALVKTDLILSDIRSS